MSSHTSNSSEHAVESLREDMMLIRSSVVVTYHTIHLRL